MFEFGVDTHDAAIGMSFSYEVGPHERYISGEQDLFQIFGCWMRAGVLYIVELGIGWFERPGPGICW